MKSALPPGLVLTFNLGHKPVYHDAYTSKDPHGFLPFYKPIVLLIPSLVRFMME